MPHPAAMVRDGVLCMVAGFPPETKQLHLYSFMTHKHAKSVDCGIGYVTTAICCVIVFIVQQKCANYIKK